MDPFATLGVEPRFDLDPIELERRHRELSRALHPDRHAAEAPAQRRIALSRAIEVNEAYRLLRDPIRRAERVLAHRGVPVGETAEPPASPQLLMEMMESREELADAVRARDSARVEALGKGMRDREAALLSRLARALEGGDDVAARAAALATLGELRYAKRFLDEVAAFEEALAG
jgi:molecular chaperone HscB